MEFLDGSVKVSSRQLRLLTLDTGLAQRLGAAFFRSLPATPGVYSFFDAAGALLYIGQSRNLQARIGSYRHVTPERHSKRILRLVRNIARVEWQACSTAEEAIERERVLLLERRPPFNRAGVWEGPPWWLTASAENGRLGIRLARHPEQPTAAGPLPSAFRYAHAAAARCLYRLSHPAVGFPEYPHGLLNQKVPHSLSWPDGNAAEFASLLVAFASGHAAPLLARLVEMPLGTNLGEQEFWSAQREAVAHFARRSRPSPTPAPPLIKTVLPLFPAL